MKNTFTSTCRFLCSRKHDLTPREEEQTESRGRKRRESETLNSRNASSSDNCCGKKRDFKSADPRRVLTERKRRRGGRERGRGGEEGEREEEVEEKNEAGSSVTSV